MEGGIDGLLADFLGLHSGAEMRNQALSKEVDKALGHCSEARSSGNEERQRTWHDEDDDVSEEGRGR